MINETRKFTLVRRGARALRLHAAARAAHSAAVGCCILATDIDIDWEFAPYQLLQASGDITLTLIDWPNSPKHGKLKLQITGDGTERTISWVAGNGGTIKKDSSWPASFTVTSINDPVFVELWTTNGGVTVFARYLGQYTS